MFHKSPTPDELNKKIKSLRADYIEMKGDNPHRLKLINLIQSFSDNQKETYQHEVAIGSCVYALIHVNKGYDLFQGEKTKKIFSFFGSELGVLLQRCLNITYDNSLGEQRALIYLTHFYHHIKAHPHQLERDERDLLLNDVGKTIQALLVNLAKKRPTYQALINNFNDLPEKYRQLGGKNLSRDKYAQFLSLLNDDLHDKNQEDKEWSEGYTIRFGAMLFMMEKIESGYNYMPATGGWFNKGSQLYKTCKSATNINTNTKDIPDNLKRKYYIDFLSYILKITLHPKEMEKWQKKYHFPDAPAFFENIQNNLAERIVELIKGTKPNARPLQYMDLLASTAASYGVTIALAKVAKKMSVTSSALTAFRLLRPEAAILITLLAYSANAYVAYKATNAVNRLIIDTASQPVVMTFSNIENFGHFCLNLFAGEKGQKTLELVDSPEFIKALKSLPSTILTNELKEKMHSVAAFENMEFEVIEEKILTFPLKSC